MVKNIVVTNMFTPTAIGIDAGAAATIASS